MLRAIWNSQVHWKYGWGLRYGDPVLLVYDCSLFFGKRKANRLLRLLLGLVAGRNETAAFRLLLIGDMIVVLQILVRSFVHNQIV